MSENLRVYTKALYGLDHYARLAPDPAAWDRPSPCEGWTARDVLGHVIALQRNMASSIAGGEPAYDPFHSRPAEYAGDDPLATWRSTMDAMLEALDHPDVIHREVVTFGRSTEVDKMIAFNVADTTIHSWDLARTFGVDDRIDPALVGRVLTQMERVGDKMRGPGIFGPAIEVGPDADDQTRFLAISGRRR